MRKAVRTIRLLRRYGIEYPIITYQEAKRAGLPLAVLAAVLDQETGGGRNVFGHDPTIFVGAGEVTKRRYLAYRKQRGPKGKGGMQGVGPMQLTWYSYQDLADVYGGCWLPRYNIRVGAEILAGNLKRHSLRDTLKLYNGSYAYADQVLRRVEKWQERLEPPVKLVEPNQGFHSLQQPLWRAYAIGRHRKFTDLGTYANKLGDHGYWPSWAFDLGDEYRFYSKGWAYLKARRLVKFYVKHREELNIDYVILGKRIFSKQKPWWHRLLTGDTSHMYHIHVSGVH